MTTVDADAAVLARLRSLCADWPEVEEAELQDRPLFRVRRKRFAIFNGSCSPDRPRWRGCGRSLHLLTEPSERAALEQDPRFAASPHHGDHGWVTCALDPLTTDWAEIAELLESAYRQAAPAELRGILDQRGSPG